MAAYAVGVVEARYIARVIKRAEMIKRESWNNEEQEYGKSEEEALKEAGEEGRIMSPCFVELLTLALSWRNDVRDWCNDMLAEERIENGGCK